MRTELVIRKKNLSQCIDKMNKEEKKKFGDKIAKSYCRKAKAAREDEIASLP